MNDLRILTNYIQEPDCSIRKSGLLSPDIFNLKSSWIDYYAGV